MSVDMASYKAEFLSHYYEKRLRPRSAYAMGFIHRWARMASWAPRFANTLTHAPVLSHLARRFAGIDRRRTLPMFAEHTFTSMFRTRHAARSGGSPGRIRVLLWPDTFNDHFHPETAAAAADVLDRAGCDVVLPPRSLCCGRPLYDYGFLGQARRALRDVLEALQPELEAGTAVVVLEPSCLAVFRDELLNLFPDDELARRLGRQACSLAEFLLNGVPEFTPPPFRRSVLLHGHCHQKALGGIGYEQTLLERMGAQVTTLDSGCCGMAGSFGFEAAHYDVSTQVGELVLLPAVRAAPTDTIIVADGFSCREQVAQSTSRRAVPLAQVLRTALRESARCDDDREVMVPPSRMQRERVAAAVLAGAGIAAGAALIRRARRAQIRRSHAKEA